MPLSSPSTHHWWQTGVIYQVYPRSFQDTTGNGVGDLAGITQHLDYLQDLGVDAIWISPFYPSPMKDHGYDVADYCDIEPLFGDLGTFDQLLAEAHQRDIKLIIDYVPNHSSDEHPWFQESRQSKDNPKRDWYIWRDPLPNGGPPNNWGSYFGGPAWTFDKKTGQYYMHQFVSGQPELNWRNPDLRQAMMDVLRFWLDRGVDGFRMDVVGLILKDEQLRDNPPNPDAPADLHENDLLGRQLSVHNMDQDDVHEIMRAFRQLTDEYDDKVIIGELWGEWDRWLKYYGEQGEALHLPFNFRLMWEPWEAGAMRRLVNEFESVLPDFAWPNYVLGNHDQQRFASRFGGRAQARVATMMLMTLRGTPTWYYGDEIGMMNVPIPPEKIQDPQAIGLGAERTRDIARTPMQWDASPNAGFAPEGVETWLPVADDYEQVNVAAQGEDPASMLSLVKQLLALRRMTPALNRGDYLCLNEDDPHCFVYQRQAGGVAYVVALNFTGEERVSTAVDLDPSQTAQLTLSTHLDRTDDPIDLSAITLRPHEGVILRLR